LCFRPVDQYQRNTAGIVVIQIVMVSGVVDVLDA